MLRGEHCKHTFTNFKEFQPNAGNKLKIFVDFLTSALNELYAQIPGPIPISKCPKAAKTSRRLAIKHLYLHWPDNYIEALSRTRNWAVDIQRNAIRHFLFPPNIFTRASLYDNQVTGEVRKHLFRSRFRSA